VPLSLKTGDEGIPGVSADYSKSSATAEPSLNLLTDNELSFYHSARAPWGWPPVNHSVPEANTRGTSGERQPDFGVFSG